MIYIIITLIILVSLAIYGHKAMKREEEEYNKNMGIVLTHMTPEVIEKIFRS